MLHRIEVLAISPGHFLRRFRGESSLLVYDPSLGARNGRIIFEEDVVKSLTGYNMLFKKWIALQITERKF